MNLSTLNDVFFTIAERGNNRVALTRQSGTWQPITAAQLQAQVYATARHLRSWGIGKGDRVAILSENSPEWAIADFATLLIGAVDVPIYATQTAEQCLHILQHSGAKVLFVSTARQYEKVSAIMPLTRVERVVMMDYAGGRHDVIPMAEILEGARPGADAEIEGIAAPRSGRRCRHAHLYLRHHGHTERSHSDAWKHRVEPEHDAAPGGGGSG